MAMAKPAGIICLIENAVEANLFAATAAQSDKYKVYDVVVGDRANLNHLFKALQSALVENSKPFSKSSVYQEFRAGNVSYFQADVSKAENTPGYAPEFRIKEGIAKAML
jgi:UDP-N-acetylglucosamine 4-epimerase